MMQLEILDLEFSYQASPVLQGVSCSIEEGQIVALVGPNGAGKSTLLKCVDRILRPQAGQVLLEKQDTACLPLIELARKVSYVPQFSTSSLSSSVFDFVLLGRKPYVQWRESEQDRQIVWDVLRSLGIDEMAAREYGQLSGGERQKVMLARALAQQPKVILLDEPTSNLDLKHQLEVLSLVKSLVKERGISALMAIHDLNLAARYADLLMFMKDGQVHACGTPESVLTKDNIAAVYQVEAEVRADKHGFYVIPLAPVDHEDLPSLSNGRYKAGVS